MRETNFDNLLKVLKKQVPDRPTLFEFFLNEKLYAKLAGDEIVNRTDKLAQIRILIHAFKNAGYDYATVKGSDDFYYTRGETHSEKTISLNEGGVITDRKSFEKYPWPNPEKCDYSHLVDIIPEIPKGMKLLMCENGGILENVISIVGYENLCYLTVEDPELVKDIFDAVGSRLLRYHEICCDFESIGAFICNDDWGFNSQTMLSPADMREYVFPWYKKIVEIIHASGRPVILHSCGNLDEVMEDIIEDMKFDGKHSYEDNIMPVEEFYDIWGSRIAVLGGLDLNFICTASPDEIKKRSMSMLRRAAGRGGYALGTGNSVPYYVPEENYFAMISCVNN